jgi:DNA-binding winged helix-turn-helix (wHTH) protein
LKVRKDFGKSSEWVSYEFGPFQVDPRERAVRRDGKLLPLTPKAFDILLVLIQNPGRILAKDDINVAKSIARRTASS